MPGPVCSAACSVDSPISQASGISAIGGEDEQRHLAGVHEQVDATVAGARASDAQRILRATARASLAAVLEAVLFDWGDTLTALGARPGPARAGSLGRARARSGASRSPGLTRRFREAYLPLLFAHETLEEVGRTRSSCGACSRRRIEVSDEELLGVPRRRAPRLAAGAAARRDDARAARDAAASAGSGSGSSRTRSTRRAAAPRPRAVRRRGAARRRRSSPRRSAGASRTPPSSSGRSRRSGSSRSARCSSATASQRRRRRSGARHGDLPGALVRRRRGGGRRRSPTSARSRRWTS